MSETRGVSDIVLNAATAGPVRRTPGQVLTGLFWLSKIAVYQHYFGLALAWLMLTPAARDRPGGTTAMLLFLVAQVGIVTCACSADDLVGYRNGSDAANYKPGQLGRNMKRKPLLNGSVTEREAVAFVAASGTLAGVAGAAAFTVLGWHVPLLSVVLFVLAWVLTVQYSAGLRISYVTGGTEVLLCLATACGLWFPYLAMQRHWSTPAVLVGLLLGMWLVMVSTYSNVNDIEGDGAVGRRTLAVATPPAVYQGAMVCFYVTTLVLTGFLALATDWPAWTLLTMAPVLVLHAIQLYLGPGQHRWFLARKIGFISYDVGFLGLLAPALWMLR